ncbi:hypothetical protein KL86PLE_130512 [uncultured Pleomorphomonas sp.]|uniref:Uncharacterized protein n=1 Tax=uncultured Pleomorphomonas sp. TaxID=442121 RepID=A0A212LC24_9HYPH|nr:hypothetical protein KL86PLE_10024 [uncultured Pleomorphomonas sp.]SCM75111.1 hypothetical protein KL86PLE_130512 [uncultured Pleomorphomonas sp.]
MTSFKQLQISSENYVKYQELKNIIIMTLIYFKKPQDIETTMEKIFC